MRKIIRPYQLSDGVTQSMMMNFMACPQRMRFSLDRWERESDFSTTFDVGDLFHYCLEHWYGINHWEAAISCKHWRLTKLAHGSDARDLEPAIATVLALWQPYLRRWKKTDSKFTWVGLEKLFDVVWHGYRLRGKVDGIFRVGRLLYQFETKTKGQIDEDKISAGLTFDFQNLFYITALEQMGLRIRGSLYNVVRNPGLRLGKTETQASLQKRIAEDIAERPEHYYHRYEVTYSEDTVKRFQRELLMKLREYEGWLAGDWKTYRRECSCFGRGYACSYLQACSQDSMVGYRQTKTLFSELQPEASAKITIRKESGGEDPNKFGRLGS